MSKKGNPTGGLNSLFGRAKQGVNEKEEKNNLTKKQNHIKKTGHSEQNKESLSPTNHTTLQINPRQLYDKKHTVIRVKKDLYTKFSEIAKSSNVPAKRIIELLITDLIKSKKPIVKITHLIEKVK